jgi:hypothetical protein
VEACGDERGECGRLLQTRDSFFPEITMPITKAGACGICVCAMSRFALKVLPWPCRVKLLVSAVKNFSLSDVWAHTAFQKPLRSSGASASVKGTPVMSLPKSWSLLLSLPKMLNSWSSWTMASHIAVARDWRPLAAAELWSICSR